MEGCVPPDLAVRVEREDCVPTELVAHAEYPAYPTASTTVSTVDSGVRMDLALGRTKSLSGVLGLVVVGEATKGAPLAKALDALGDPRFGGHQ